MEKARDKFKIGQLVVILVHNSHHGDIGQVVGFGEYNEYNVKVSFEGNYVQGYMVDELKPLPRLGQKLSVVGRLKKAYYRWRNSDPVKKCPVYQKQGCSHVDGMLCKFPDCSTYRKYMGHHFVSCVNCVMNSSCCSRNYGLGC